MNYLYYPGCSLHETGRAYDESMRAVFECLEIPMMELPDWNCCGATMYMAIDEKKAFALAARNLALAEQHSNGSVDLIAPCAACYLGLSKVQHYLDEYPDIEENIQAALHAGGLSYSGKVNVRHPIDVLLNDYGFEYIADRVTNPLSDVKVACYYGCQLVRPFADFDDQDNPTTMDQLMLACGTEIVDWPLKTRCCGASLTGTVEEVGLRLNYILIKEARANGADVVATACPLCQFNLECYQKKMSRKYHDHLHVPAAFFTQIMGTALGLSDKALGIKRLFLSFQHLQTV